jgi:hypothetical protein
MPVVVLGHPLSTRKVTIEGPSRAIGLLLWINMQYDPRNLSPVGTLLIGIKQSK